MSTIDPKIAYASEKDPLYDITSNKKIPVDQSTTYRGSNRITPQSGSADITGLNVNGAQTKIIFSNGSNFKIRWDTCCLAVTCTFTDGQEAETYCTKSVPAFNAISKNIESINLLINNSSTDVYSCSNSLYSYDYTSRLLTNYSWDVLNNNMNEQIFGPIYLENETEFPKYMTSETATFSYTQKIRMYLNRIGDIIKGDDYTYTTKYIPFVDLFPRFPQSVIGNIRNVEININWRDASNDCMECQKDDKGMMYIVKCEVLTDYYVMSPITMTSEVMQKTQQTVDNVGYLNTQVLEMTYNGGDIQISNVKNLQYLMIMQESLAMGNKDNTLYGESIGQYMLINNAKNSATTFFPFNVSTCDQDNLTGITEPISSIQIQYGEISYPS